MSDKVILRGCQFFARHGVTPSEHEVGGRYTIDVELESDLAAAAAADDLRATISYAEVYVLIQTIVENEHYQLVETLAEQIAARLLDRFPAPRVRLRVLKTPPPLQGIVEAAGVEIERRRHG